MIAEIGQFAINISLALSLIIGCVLLTAAHYRNLLLMKLESGAVISFFGLMSIAFACLIASYVMDDFSLSVIIQNSHTKQPLLYKIAAAWGNHEGSLILWVWVLALMALLVSLLARIMPVTLKARTIGILLLISASFLLFIIWTSNPFMRVFPVPLEGQELNPLLQDPALALHPPMLYVGYVGLSVAFAIAIAGLLEKKIDIVWAHCLKPWVLLAWVFLTAGIALGSWWAYYELGWGGFWFWDPVENVSFMPWLLATALLHSVIVAERRGAFKSWTVFLAICCFSLSLMGTFIVRSGIITSVHAFASDPERGVFILILLAIIIGLSLFLYAWRAPYIKAEGHFTINSRESGLLFNNWLLASLTLIVFVGTLFPLFLEAFTNDKITVGPPYYNIAFAPIVMVLAVAMAIVPFLSWKKGNITQALLLLRTPFMVSLLIAIIAGSLYDYAYMSAIIGVFFGVWVISASLKEFIYRMMGGTKNWRNIKRIIHMPIARYGTLCAHAGIGFIIIGAVGASALTQEKVVQLQHNEPILLLDGYKATLTNVTQKPLANFNALEAAIMLRHDNAPNTTMLRPQIRYYTSARDTNEVAMQHHIWGDIYIALKNADPKKQQAVIHFYIKPFASFLWLGALLLVLGGIFALCDRKIYIAVRTKKAGHTPT